MEQAVVRNPNYADAYFRLGIALETQGDTRGAIAAYHRTTELLPSLTEAWYRAGGLVYTLGHRNEAIRRFRQAAATGGKTTFGRLGKARALLNGRGYLSTEDIAALAAPVLRHRIVTNFSAESEGITTDLVVERLLKETPSKEGELTQDPRFEKIFAA